MRELDASEVEGVLCLLWINFPSLFNLRNDLVSDYRVHVEFSVNGTNFTEAKEVDAAVVELCDTDIHVKRDPQMLHVVP